MSATVSETKMFHLNESVNLNTNRMCTLQDAAERTAGISSLPQPYLNPLTKLYPNQLTKPNPNSPQPQLVTILTDITTHNPKLLQYS